MDSDNNFRFDDDLMALAGLSSAAPGLHSESEMPEIRDDATRLEPKVSVSSHENPKSEKSSSSNGRRSVKAPIVARDVVDVFADPDIVSASERESNINNRLSKAKDLPAVLENLAKHSDLQKSVSSSENAKEDDVQGLSASARHVSANNPKRPSSNSSKRVSRSSEKAGSVDIPKSSSEKRASRSSEKAGSVDIPKSASAKSISKSSEKVSAIDSPKSSTEKGVHELLKSDELQSLFASASEKKVASSEATQAVTSSVETPKTAENNAVVPQNTQPDDLPEDEKEDLFAGSESASGELDEVFEPRLDARRFTQELVMRGRSMSHSLVNIGGTKQRSGRFWLTVFCAAIFVTLLVILAHYKHRDIMLDYELSTAIIERENLLEENRRLRIELRVLNSHERLSNYKDKQLGLQSISGDQMQNHIIFINHKPREHKTTGAKNN